MFQLAVSVALVVLLSNEAFAQRLNLGGCPDVKVKAPFDVSKYVGEWYEIEKIPASFEAGLKCNKAKYEDKGDYVSVVNSGVNERTGKASSIEGKATIPDQNVPSKLKVKFNNMPFKADYWILDTDYEKYSVVYSCFSIFKLFDAEYLWILSRTSTLDDATKESIYKFLDDVKIDRTHLKATAQDC